MATFQEARTSASRSGQAVVFQGKSILSNPFLLSGILSLSELGQAWERIEIGGQPLLLAQRKLRATMARLGLKRAQARAAKAQMEACEAKAAYEALKVKYAHRQQPQSKSPVRQWQDLPKQILEMPLVEALARGAHLTVDLLCELVKEQGQKLGMPPFGQTSLVG